MCSSCLTSGEIAGALEVIVGAFDLIDDTGALDFIDAAGARVIRVVPVVYLVLLPIALGLGLLHRGMSARHK